MNKRIRLIDVAEAAQTSIKTVSRVLNNDERVSDELRERVQRKMNDLGYQVDIIARSLRTGVDKVIGVVIPKIGDPFFAELVEEVETVANEHGIGVIVGSTHGELMRENELVHGFIQRKVLGMIIAPQDADYSFLNQSRRPTIFIDRAPEKYKGDVVRVDDEYGGKIATEHLIKNGHTRIVYFADDMRIKPTKMRFDGYKAALHDAGIKLDESLLLLNLKSDTNLDSIIVSILNLKNPPTAFFTSKTEIAINIVSSMHKIKRTDIALVSFDDFTLASSIQPAITVLDHSPRKIGRAAITKLFEKIDGKDLGRQEHIIPLKIVQRGSGEIKVKVGA